VNNRCVAADRFAVLKKRFDDALRALHELLASLKEDDWTRICSAEGWPVALEGLHIGLGLRRQGGFLDDAFVRGKPARFSWDETNDLNAMIAKRRRPSPHFVIRFVLEEAERVHARLAKLTSADLERATIDYEGRVLTLDQFMRGFLIGQVEGHTESIRNAITR